MVLCSDNSGKSLEDYDPIEIRRIGGNNRQFKLTPLKPIPMESFSGQYQPFGPYRMCRVLPASMVNIQIIWHNVTRLLRLYFTVDPAREPFVKQSITNGVNRRLMLSNEMETVNLQFSKVEIFEFYVSDQTNHTAAYPFGPDSVYQEVYSAYNQHRCVDYFLVETLEKSVSAKRKACGRKYRKLLNSIEDGWKEVTESSELRCCEEILCLR